MWYALAMMLLLLSQIFLIAQSNATYVRNVPGPTTDRSIHEVLDQLPKLYPNCEALMNDLRGEVVVDVGTGRGRFIRDLRARDPVYVRSAST